MVSVTPLVLIFANYVLSMFKIDHEPLHTHIRAFECIWTIETAKIWLSVEIQ